MAAYKRRFQIAFLFRDAKQFRGLPHAQVRDKEKLDFHFNCSFAVVNMARVIANSNPSTNENKAFSSFSFNNANPETSGGYNDLLLNEFIRNLDPKFKML